MRSTIPFLKDLKFIRADLTTYDKLWTDEFKKCDLIIANNVLAHVPDLNDFIKGIHKVLKSDGFVSIEFPHLLNLIKFNQFDTIYHEHYSYLSLGTVKKITESVGMIVNDVEKYGDKSKSLGTNKE